MMESGTSAQHVDWRRKRLTSFFISDLMDGVGVCQKCKRGVARFECVDGASAADNGGAAAVVLGRVLDHCMASGASSEKRQMDD